LAVPKTRLSGQRVLDQFKKCGVTHIVCLPDSGLQFIYEAMMSQDEITPVPVCREGEAIAIATGLLLGGKKPVVMHQNSGIYESGDSIRGLALGLKLPLLLILGHRGWQRQAPITDSCAIFLEPILDTWGIKHYLVEYDEDAEQISTAYQEAEKTKKPVAILIARA